MFKSMLKRSWLSIRRKTSRTIILTLILFVMANLMLATIAIKSAVGESISYAKETLGGTVYLQPDMEKIRDQAMQNSPGSGGFMQSVRIERPNIPIETAKSLADSEYVKDYTYQIQGSANANGFTPIETEEQRMRKEIESQMESQGSVSFPDGRSGGGIVTRFAFGGGDIRFIGINSFAFIPDVESGNMKLSTGEIFDESTDHGIVISYDLSLENNISVGDSLTLATTSADNPTDITLTVIGIYDNTTDNFNPNTIYANIDTAARFLPEDQYNNGDYGVQSVKYYLVSAEHKDAFLAEANQKYPNLADDNLKLNIDTAAYEQMVGPIESVGSFASTILWIVIIASVIIITLIITIDVKDRRYEMGVLMSLGATKQNILGQTLTELLAIGTIAFALSIIPSAFIARAMGDGLLQQQITMNEQSQSQNYGRGNNANRDGMMSGGPVTTRGSGPSGPISFMGGQPQSDVEAINEINVTPSVNNYIVLFLAGYGIIIIALIIPTVGILRFEPKTILTGKE
jgi:putative ABC transport system permease protein